MRILILTPTALPSVTGNAMTVERWRRGLTAQGLEVRVCTAEEWGDQDLAQELETVRPDVIHVHHSFRAGSLLLNPAAERASRKVPLVVSPGGTDVNLDVGTREKRQVVLEVLRRSRAIVLQGAAIEARLREIAPDLRDRFQRVPKSFAWLGEDPFDLRAAAGCAPGEVLFFFPAGVRPVKGNVEGLLALERVRSARPGIRAVFAGPALDLEYCARFQEELQRLRGLARWIPPIPPQAMRAAYEGADVVLNTSLSEGLSNVLLEAAASGRPSLASDIPGNRWPVMGAGRDAPAGLLYDPSDPEDFVRQALRLADDEGLRRRLGDSGRERAARWPGPEAEAAVLSDVYRRALTGTPPSR